MATLAPAENLSCAGYVGVLVNIVASYAAQHGFGLTPDQMNVLTGFVMWLAAHLHDLFSKKTAEEKK